MENKITYLKTILRSDENVNYIIGAQTFVGEFKQKTPNAEDEIFVEVIDKDEYDNLLEIFKTSPKAEQGFAYGLKTDLTWEKYEVPIVKEEGKE